MPDYRFLLCGTDAGGGRNIAPIAETLATMPAIEFSLLGGPITDAMFDAGIGCRIDIRVDDEADALNLLEAVRPDALFVGRTRYASPERHLTVAARQLGVPSLQIVDDWMNYRWNVTDEQDDFRHLTDLVCCPDARAVEEAAAEGLPRDVLVATGSPYLSDLWNRAQEMIISPPSRPGFLPPAYGMLTILFVSETFVADHGDGEEVRAHGAFMGYTEVTVRDQLARALLHLGDTVRVVEKLHPSEPEIPLPPVDGINWISVRDVNLVDLIWHADLVIGMRSIALLESALLGRPTVSYQPGLKGAQTCSAVRHGYIPSLRSFDKLCEWIAAFDGAEDISVDRPDFADAGSSDRIIGLGIELAQFRQSVTGNFGEVGQ